jgi:hypothetical protein
LASTQHQTRNWRHLPPMRRALQRCSFGCADN